MFICSRLYLFTKLFFMHKKVTNLSNPWSKHSHLRHTSCTQYRDWNSAVPVCCLHSRGFGLFAWCIGLAQRPWSSQQLVLSSNLKPGISYKVFQGSVCCDARGGGWEVSGKADQREGCAAWVPLGLTQGTSPEGSADLVMLMFAA